MCKTLVKKYGGLLLWLLLCYVAAGLGALASIEARDFYSQLAQPEWAPPAWLFGPVWAVLYAMMAVAAWLVWGAHPAQTKRMALAVFLLQLLVNALWTWLFFAWKLGSLALFDILLLTSLILVCVVLFYRINTVAGLLLIPYLLWVSFASVLNYTMLLLNPDAL